MSVHAAFRFFAASFGSFGASLFVGALQYISLLEVQYFLYLIRTIAFLTKVLRTRL
jgi:hypothetical protein